MNVRKSIICTIVFSIFMTIMVGCGSTEQVVSEVTPAYPDYYKLEDLISNSSNIIHASVQKHTTAQPVNVKLPDGESMKTLYTPIVLDIKEVIRGTMAKNTTTYFQMGGETDELNTIVTGHPLLQAGEEIVLFYESNGYGWGELSTYRVVDGRVTLNTDKLPDVYTQTMDTPTTTFDIDGFLDLVRYISVSQGGQTNS